MKEINFSLYIEINNSNYVFYVEKHNNEKKSENIYDLKVPIRGIENKRFSDYETVSKIIQEKIFFIEQKFNYSFKEIILILENFNPKFINLTGFKKLNGSQVLRENITYIINTLKSYVDKIEKKYILHIFNSKFILDFKKIENLPIGLFGDFYSHELSFVIINQNDYKNLQNIFANCNLKIKKILLKSFIKGANISETNHIETFFQIQINNSETKVFFFENDSLKFEQDFSFGYEIILRDISKITSLKIDTIKLILDNSEFAKLNENEIVEKKYFNNENYRKIKKKLIFDIVQARVKEIFDLIIFKNINLKYNIEFASFIFLDIQSEFHPKIFKEIYQAVINEKKSLKLKFLENLSNESLISTANKIVHFGWKKEAIPVSKATKSIVARFFDTIFS